MTDEQVEQDSIALEKRAGQKAARTVRRNLKTILATATVKRTGTMLRIASAVPKIRFGELESIDIKATGVTFIQHYGFEGIKKNGVAMNLKAQNHFDFLFDKSNNALEKLVDEIADIRGFKVVNRISNMVKLLSDERAN